MATPSNISDHHSSDADRWELIEYQGFWYHKPVLQGLRNLEQHFQAKSTDILLASYPKSGTTWLKALLVSITQNTSPLLTASPHQLVPTMENRAAVNPNFSSPLFHTHVPYCSLPESIKSSGCRIVYVFRDPKDVVVSLYHFIGMMMVKLDGLPLMSLETVVKMFCSGKSVFGPYWDHVLGYWKASVEFPDKVLFLRYEDLKKEPCYYTKRLFEFLGYPLVDEAVVEEMVDFCSFEKLSNLEVNRSGTYMDFNVLEVENKVYFRRGEVGDSKNHLTVEMMNEIDEITKEKFKDFPQLLHKTI